LSQLPQAAISSIVRMQPAHQPVAASIVHTLVQGLGISVAMDEEAYASDCPARKDRRNLL